MDVEEAQREGLVRLVARVVRSRWWLGVVVIVGAVMHAAGHAFLAAAGGLLARSLAGGAPLGAGSSQIGVALPETDGLVLLASAGVLAAIGKMVGGALGAWGEGRIAAEVAGLVRRAALEEVLGTSKRQRDHGDRLAALTTHVAEVERGVAQGVLAEARAATQLVPLAVLLVVLAPRLAGSAAAALGAFAVVVLSLRRAFKRTHDDAARAAGVLAGAADEAVRHAELWATYGAKRRIRAHVDAIGAAVVRQGARIRVRAALLSSMSEVTGALALVLVLVLAARGALGVDRGTVVPFAIAFFMTYRPLRDLIEARLSRARGEAALARATPGSASMPPPAPEAARGQDEAPPPAWPLHALVLEDVVAAHGTSGPLTATILPGEIVALVGPTGIGKTSLLRGLLGLDPLRQGTVRYGTTSIGDAGVGPAARPFAWGPQDAPVVGDTLAANVALGRPDGQDEGDPAKLVEELGGRGLAASLGDARLVTGRAVSGGERQWICVARAVATGLPVLLLDEPTSALDGAAQAKLLEAIARLRGRRTVIIVTHRPEPLAIADRVITIATPSARA